MPSPDASTDAFLAQLIELSREISEGNYDHIDTLLQMTKKGEHPEHITDLAEAFGMMTVKIEAREYQLERTIETLKEKNEELSEALRQLTLQEKIKGLLNRFVPESVRKRVEANPENPDLEKHASDISVLFLDIAGYTAMSERLSSDEINQVIERYFSSFLDDIYLNHGDINETAGDGLMVIFQHEDPTLHAFHAVQAALAIREKVGAVNRSPDGQNTPVNINIGINFGEALLGSTRMQSSVETRWTFTASGMTTNVAARLSRLATEGIILISEETARRVEKFFELENHGHHRLKNVSDPVAAWRVSAPRPSQ